MRVGGRGAHVGWDQSHPSAAGCPVLINMLQRGFPRDGDWCHLEIVAIFCPLGQARDLCVQRHTQADTLL